MTINRQYLQNNHNIWRRSMCIKKEGVDDFGNNRNECDTKGLLLYRSDEIRRALGEENITLPARQDMLCWCGLILRMDDGNKAKTDDEGENKRYPGKRKTENEVDGKHQA